MQISTILSYLKNPFLLAAVLAIFVTIAFMIDAKVSDRDRDRADYLKLFSSIFFSVIGSHYFLKSGYPQISRSQHQSGGSGRHHSSFASAPQPSHTQEFTSFHAPSGTATASAFDSSDVFVENPNF